ncbi:MAG: RNA methyltransferase, partial [Cyanobacteria bacterium J083]
MGAKAVKPSFTGVSFQGNRELLYRVNLWSRTIFRVLMPIATLKATNPEQLYSQTQTLDWSKYLSPHQTLAVNCTGGNRLLNHTHFTALQIKNAIVDWQTSQYGQRSHINTRNPDILVNAHIYQNQCTLSLDSSGSSLHRRGYRPAVGLAPIKETLAAAILQIINWQPNIPLFDPLCGSGTILIEAALKGLNIPPGLYRQKFALENWLDFDPHLWQKLQTEAKNQQKFHLDVPIVGSDRNQKIIIQAKHNLALCGLEDAINFRVEEFANIQPPCATGIIFCNPPYGKRIGQEPELIAFYQSLGDIFKQRFKGWTAYILTGNRELAKKVGLKASQR